MMNRICVCMLAVLFLLGLRSADADSIFSQAATATPPPTATPAPPAVPETDPEGLAPQETEKTEKQNPEAAFSETEEDPSSVLLGHSYTDMTGHPANHTARNGETQLPVFTYNRVTEENYRRYQEFLSAGGWKTKSAGTDGSLTAFSEENQSQFRVSYDPGRLTLTLSCMRYDPPADETPAPAEPSEEERICRSCDRGRCRTCDGRGYTDCEQCCGSGVCGVCFGKPRKYTGWGSYVTCHGCNGSGRCSFCGGRGRKECVWCDGGICRKCGGDYQHAR